MAISVINFYCDFSSRKVEITLSCFSYSVRWLARRPRDTPLPRGNSGRQRRNSWTRRPHSQQPTPGARRKLPEPSFDRSYKDNLQQLNISNSLTGNEFRAIFTEISWKHWRVTKSVDCWVFLQIDSQVRLMLLFLLQFLLLLIAILHALFLYLFTPFVESVI